MLLIYHSFSRKLRWLLAWLALGSEVVILAQDQPILIESENLVEKGRLDANWQKVAARIPVAIGDQIRVGELSRAAIQFTDLSVLRINELTTIELFAPTGTETRSGLDLMRGAAYLLSREKPRRLELRTPSATGAIRGTEFHAEVDATGILILTMFEGTVELSNPFGKVTLGNGEQGIAEPGRAPRKTAVIDATRIVQWCLYYPAVLAPNEIPGLDASLPIVEQYRRGNLLGAVASLKSSHRSLPPEYMAALYLSVGQVDEAEKVLTSVRNTSAARALRRLIETVRSGPHSDFTPHSGSEWLAESYARQASFQLPEALDAAKRAVELCPDFGFAHVRVAELEFSFGQNAKARAALKRGMELSPDNASAYALNGFIAASFGQMKEAGENFEWAIQLDGALGNGWLGSGLVKIRTGHRAEGVRDLEAAAAMEPNRSLLRSYLGKGFGDAGHAKLAFRELDRAVELDEKDPTPWLYRALENAKRNRLNTAIRDLEKSQALNGNRALYRSRLLLDQDDAVRSINLALIYQRAGLPDVSLEAASLAVNSDFSNGFAHRFLAESYYHLIDPNRIALRYNSAWTNELSLANLLSPVGAGDLSATISQQEYGSLLASDGVRFYASSEWESDGIFTQLLSSSITHGSSSLAVDFELENRTGDFTDTWLRRRELFVTVKQAVGAQDTFFGQLFFMNNSGGNDSDAVALSKLESTQVRVEETQTPSAVMGWRHEWQPGSQTLALVSRLNPLQKIKDQDSSAAFNVFPSYGNLNADLDALIWTGELAQVWQSEWWNAVAGGRYQSGSIDTNARFRSPSTAFDSSVDPEFTRASGYLYVNVTPSSNLTLTTGFSYDSLSYPINFRSPPYSSKTDKNEGFSPKLGLVWQPASWVSLRAAYTKSYGGVLFDDGYRLEPTLVGGLNQTYRSLAPELFTGSLAGNRIRTAGVAIDFHPDTDTYFGAQFQSLRTEISDSLGNSNRGGPFPIGPKQFPQTLAFEEKILTGYFTRLVGYEFSVGGRGEWSWAKLHDEVSELETLEPFAYYSAEQTTKGELGRIQIFGGWNSATGLFGYASTTLWLQESRLPEQKRRFERFWELDLQFGYRLPDSRFEISLGIENLLDQNHRIVPVNYYQPVPRGRNFFTRVSVSF